jgi:hypothetical protein
MWTPHNPSGDLHAAFNAAAAESCVLEDTFYSKKTSKVVVQQTSNFSEGQLR